VAAQSRGSTRRILVGAAAGAAIIGVGAVVRSRRTRSSASFVAEPNPALSDPVHRPETISVTSADGHPIHVVAYGDPEAQPIVLSHGWTCSTAYWYPQINALADDFRVITYDQRGHGRTELGRNPLSTDLLADDLAAVLEATVTGDKKAVVVGHSMGGMSIMSWAGKYPEHVRAKARAVMLASTATDSLVAESTLIPLSQRLPTIPPPVGRGLLGWRSSVRVDTPAARRVIQYAAMAPGSTREEVEFCTRIVLDCHGRTRGGWGAALSMLDIRAALENLQVPTTVLVGTADRLTPQSHSRRISDVLDEAGHLQRLIRLPAIGHMSTVEAPGPVNDEIRRLARL
jgi:pimeloyl-ACP methyl ester carboxylesterase